MGEVILVIGGAKSGKTGYALKIGEVLCGSRLYYLATAVICDEEMKEKIEIHIQERGDRWKTIEAPYELDKGLVAADGDGHIILVDCLTMWINNLLFKGLTNEEILGRFNKLISTLLCMSATTIVVTNEVGEGIVPADGVTRRFRDLVGKLNQEMASIAKEVFFVVAGIPIKIKG